MRGVKRGLHCKREVSTKLLIVVPYGLYGDVSRKLGLLVRGVNKTSKDSEAEVSRKVGIVSERCQQK